MKRRDFVLWAAAGVSAVAIPTVYYYRGDVEFDSRLAQPQALSFIWDVQTITLIGNRYRTNVPDENSVRSLVKLLNGNPSDSGESVVSGLSERVTNDFKAGNTILVDGWILSVTEARQCALASTQQVK